jgi:hypothetical protein
MMHAKIGFMTCLVSRTMGSLPFEDCNAEQQDEHQSCMRTSGPVDKYDIFGRVHCTAAHKGYEKDMRQAITRRLVFGRKYDTLCQRSK